MIYTVFYRKGEPRAPSKVSLDDYTEVGTIEASYKSQITTKIAKPDDHSEAVLLRPKRVSVGDLVIDEDDCALIFTPTGVWATVEVV